MQIFAIILLIFNILFCGFLYFEPTHTTNLNYLYNASYGLNFLLASYLSFSFLKAFPKQQSALLSFASAFTSFTVAQAIWIYYNLFTNTEIPYPGPADFFWVLFYFLIALGVVLLLKSFSVSLTFSNLMEILVISGLIFLIISSFLSLNNTQVGLPFLTKLLNYAYPICDSILIALSITALRSHIGRLNSNFLYFIFGFIALTIGDTTFAYQTTLETYWNGNITDLTYAISGFLLLIATINLPKLFNSQDQNLST